MKKVLLLFLLMFVSPAFASGIGASSASAPCTNNTLETYSGNTNLQADWQPNTINLNWYNGDTKLTVQSSAQSCVYDGALTIPSTQPTRTGYTFAGWEVRLPGAYTELEYLEATTLGSYIDTGVVFNSSNTYKIAFSKGGSRNCIMGVRQESEYYKKGNFSITFCGGTCVYSSTNTGSTQADFGDTVYGVKHTVQYQQSTRTLLFDNGGNYWNNDWLTYIEIPYNMYLFGFDIAGSDSVVGGVEGYIRIYSYSVANAGNALIQNLVPARRNSDNVLGMYDTVSKTFLTNAGTGSFTAGPVVQ